MLFRKESSREIIASQDNQLKANPAPISALKKSPLEGFKGDGVVLVGKGTLMKGEIKDCTIIEIQGQYEGNVIANAVIVRDGASFKGTIHCEFLEVHGLVEGAVVAEQLLDIRATGKILAEVQYGELCVATGGRLSGAIRNHEIVDGKATKTAELITINGHQHPSTAH